MKIPRKPLAKALALLYPLRQKITDPHNRAALGNQRVFIGHDHVLLHTHDLQVYVKLPIEDGPDEAVGVPMKWLKDAVCASTSGTIKVDTSIDNFLKVTTATIDTGNLVTTAQYASVYHTQPSWVEDNGTRLEAIPADIFMTALRYVHVAAARTDCRSNMFGVALDKGKMFATDGHRIHSAPLPLAEKPFFIKTPLARSILKVPACEEIVLSQGAARCDVLEAGDVTFRWMHDISDETVSSVHDKMSEVFKEESNIVLVDRPQLVSGLRAIRTAIGKSPSTYGCHPALCMEASRDGVTFSVFVRDQWRGEEAVYKYNPHPSLFDKINVEVKVGACINYVLQALNHPPSSKVDVRFSSGTGPIYFDHGDGYKAIVMPMRL